jgi:CheY-like chemotaxis protein
MAPHRIALILLSFDPVGTLLEFFFLMRPVLYADDDRDDVFFMHHAWAEVGIANPLIDAADGQEAIDYLAGNGPFADRQKHPLPCLLLLDLNMPVKNGFEVLQWIRGRARLKTLRVVIISGSNQASDIKTAQELGITDYVVKPVGVAGLIDLLRAKRDLWLAHAAD